MQPDIDWYEAELERTRDELRQLHALARLGTWSWEIAANRIEWSDVLYDIAGWERGSPIDFSRYSRLLHPDDAEWVGATITKAVESGQGYRFEHRIVREDGAVRWLRSFGDVVRDENGVVTGLLGTAQDVTDIVSRQALEQENQRIRFIAHASEQLASSLDYETTLKNVAQLAVPIVADWCVVDILAAHGAPQRLALHHSDPAKVALVQEMSERYPSDPNSRHGVHEVVRTGKTIYVPEISAQLLRESAMDARHLELLESLGLRSYVIVPLHARGRVLGAITAVYAESGRTFDSLDVQLLEDLGRRGGIAIDNAMLVHTLEETQEKLEQQASTLEAQTVELEIQTEELQARTEQLAASEHRYEQILNSVEDKIFTKEPGSKVTWANRAACAYYGLTVDGLRSITDNIDDDVRVFETGQPVEVAWEPSSGPDGITRYFHTVKTPIFDADGQVIELVGVSRDVTTEARARKAIEEANRAKSDFLAVMSHELRTPLNAMIGYSDLLLEGLPAPIPDAARPSVQRIGLSAKHLLELIDEILLFSRLEAGREQLNVQHIELKSLVNEVCAIAEPLALQKGLLFTCTVDGAVTAPTDARKLRQILLNLVGNAIKFTESGQVLLDVVHAGEHVVISVADSGIGMTDEQRLRIFEPFYQVESSLGKRTSGTGLGLSISRKFAEMMGAELTVTSTPGSGSVFTLSLPLQPEDLLQQSEAAAEKA